MRVASTFAARPAPPGRRSTTLGPAGRPALAMRALVLWVGLAGVLALFPAAAPATAAPRPSDGTTTAAASIDDPDDAPDSEDLRIEVERLRADVTRLETEASAAVEAYNTARSDLQSAILDELRAQSELDQAQQASQEIRADAERRIHGLYRSGPGTDTVLVLFSGGPQAAADTGGGGLTDVALTLRTTRSMLAADVEAALARQREMLAEADASLLATIEAERREAEAIALAWALSERAAATVAAAAAPSVAAGDATVTFLTQAATTTADPAAAAATAAATSRLGAPYTWGATGPSTFDCSGLTQWAYAQAGLQIPRTSRRQYAGLPLVDLSGLQPGDLVFYAYDDTPGSIHHVGLSVGGGLMIHAPKTGDVVRVAPIDRMPVFGAVRPTAASA